MVYAFPGRSGEILNFDDIMMSLAEARHHELSVAQGQAGDRILCRSLKHGFNVVNYGLRDLYQGKIEALEFRNSLRGEFAYLAKRSEDYLPIPCFDKAKAFGWIGIPDHS